MAKIQKNVKHVPTKIKLSRKNRRTIIKKVVKARGATAMEVDDPTALLAVPDQSKTSLKKGRKHAKQAMNASIHLPESTEPKVKQMPRINENRIRQNALPLFLNPKAKTLKNITPDVISQTVIAPCRRISKKKFKKMLNRKDKLEKKDKEKQEAAAKKMDTT